MSDTPISWFHCARCGSLFQAPIGAAAERTCTSCGRDPSLGVITMDVKAIPAIKPENTFKDEDWNGPNERHRKRQAKSGGPMMMMLVVGWTVVMGGIVLMANRCWKSNDPRQAAWTRQTEEQLSTEDGELLRTSSAACQSVLSNVVSHSTPEGISPFVFNRADTFSDMVRYYRMSPSTQVVDTQVQTESMSVIHLPEGPAIEGRWRSDDGRLIDAVFRRVGDEWLIDWHHFARFSEHPWALFLAGDGPEEAEFRLLARQRLARQVLDHDERPLSLVFHAPRFGRPDDPGPPSPVFELDRESVDARLLAAGFEQSREGRRPFRALLPSVEPDEDMMRVRVVVRRVEAENERRFEIVKVRACHWLQLDDPGVSPDDSANDDGESE